MMILAGFLTTCCSIFICFCSYPIYSIAGKLVRCFMWHLKFIKTSKRGILRWDEIWAIGSWGGRTEWNHQLRSVDLLCQDPQAIKVQAWACQRRQRATRTKIALGNFTAPRNVDSADRHVFSSRIMWSRPLSTIATMMRPGNPVGSLTQHRHWRTSWNESPMQQYVRGKWDGSGFIRKDIMQWMQQKWTECSSVCNEILRRCVGGRSEKFLALSLLSVAYNQADLVRRLRSAVEWMFQTLGARWTSIHISFFFFLFFFLLSRTSTLLCGSFWWITYSFPTRLWTLAMSRVRNVY